MSIIFISHSWEDNEISRKIAQLLKKDGFQIWIDYSRMLPGDRLPLKIGNAIKNCDTMILIWSKSACTSDWVEKEWTCADALQKDIIPCILDNTELPIMLRPLFYIDHRFSR